jgi:hypothetical protein
VHGAIISFHAVERQRDDPQVGDLLRQLENTPQLLDVVASCITTCWDVQTFDANVGCCFAIHGFFIEDHPDMVDTLQSFYTQRGNQAISQRRGALFESMCLVPHNPSPDSIFIGIEYPGYLGDAVTSVR